MEIGGGLVGATPVAKPINPHPPSWSGSPKPDAGAEASEDELKAFVKDRLAPYKYPRFIEFVNELPKTATGKIQRFKLREQAA